MEDKERDFWIKKTESYRNSGLSAIQWCKEEGIAVHKLRYRITKLNKEKQDKSTKTKWTTVIAKDIIEEKSASPLKVIIGKSTIEISSGFDPDTFESVVKILSQC